MAKDDDIETKLRRASQKKSWYRDETEYKEERCLYDGPSEMSLESVIRQILGKPVKADSETDYIGQYD